VDRLHAAPAAAAARSHGEGLARPEQPYLSADAATKAAHQAWQPPEQKDWRKVLTAKKHRAANKALFEEAEREQAARLIQVCRRECLYVCASAPRERREGVLGVCLKLHFTLSFF
jgi:hypothetical protein